MTLPVEPPVKPMLAKAADALPLGEGWLYEPKWDGFRCIVFRDGNAVTLGSRNERPLTRYFPEVIEFVRAECPERCVLDGELVVPAAEGLDFDALLQRIHPAESRVKRLAHETPASLIAFDVLALDGADLRALPFIERRAQLDQALGTASRPVYLSPITADGNLAQAWFVQFEGAGLDGIVAKRAELPYRSDERVMIKVKHHRTADCVVAGFRWHKDGLGVGSLLLGLYDDAGELHHVGVCSGFTAKQRRELVDQLAPLREHALEGHPWRAWASPEPEDHVRRMPGSPSRWNNQKDLSWVAVRPELVCEVNFTQLQGQRFRHAASFARWRPDRMPDSFRYAQLEVAAPLHLDEVFR